MMSFKEVALWLVNRNGQCLNYGIVSTMLSYPEGMDNVQCDAKVRKWDDSEWHPATKEYCYGEG